MLKKASSDPTGHSQPSQSHIAVDRRVIRKAIIAAALGNAVEWYDAAVYLYIAGTLGKVFFAHEQSSTQLMYSLALFALAYFVRPIGGMILGPLSDRIGRQKVLSFTIIMMGVATFGIGLIPTPDAIGYWSVGILLICRFAQGFSTGGEYGSATTFIAEYAPDNRRGFYGAWLEVGTLGGFALGAAVVAGLTSSIGQVDMEAWGWRIPFLVAAPLSLIGYYLRKRLEDTPAFRELEERSQTLTGASTADQLHRTLSAQWKQLTKCAGLVIVFNVGYYLVLTYLPVYLSTEVGFSEADGLALAIVIMIGMMIANPFVGLLSDFVGRKKVLYFGCISFILGSVPAFMLMQGTTTEVIVGVVLLSAIFTCFTGVIPSTLPALFPTAVRNGALAISYNVSVSIFGGTTPLIATSLIAATGNKLMPAYWMMFAAVIGLIAVFKIKESACQPLPGSSSLIAVDGTHLETHRRTEPTGSSSSQHAP